MEPRTAIVCARARMPVLWAGVALIVTKVVTGERLGTPWAQVVAALGGIVFVVGMALYLRIGTVRSEPVPLDAPVRGRWLALNSPAGRVPSHGTHAYGQTYAVDMAHDPIDRPRQAFGWWPLARRAKHFPAFGQPVLAPADGVVVRVHDRERDHWSRNSWPGLLYLLVEGSLRECLGPGRILGNHVVIDIGDGRYVAMAHLRRRSIRVSKGQAVTAGQQLASCGNSGNSTEPHLHFQLMDHPNVLFAAGLPLRFRYQADGGVHSGVPGNGQAFVARSGTTCTVGAAGPDGTAG